MSLSLSRKNLFGGTWGGRAEPIRPPWAVAETAFTDLCTACGDCIAACPQAIIVRGRAGYPAVDFTRGACDFCGACRRACPESAFGSGDSQPWQLLARVSETCLSSLGITCRVCAEWCDARAIRFRPEVGGRSRPVIEAAACTGCGACVSVCPEHAIHLEDAI